MAELVDFCDAMDDERFRERKKWSERERKDLEKGTGPKCPKCV
jgi:hypothetical protein